MTYHEDVFYYKTMTTKTHEFLCKKYAHEIQTQREMIGSIREETFKRDYDPEKYQYLLNVLYEYSGILWNIFHYEAEQIEKGKS